MKCLKEYGSVIIVSLEGISSREVSKVLKFNLSFVYIYIYIYIYKTQNIEKESENSY